MKDKNIKQNKSGFSLLMTIIILATVLASIVGISVLVISQLQLSRNVNHAILAYYGAETGIERSLLVIKQARNAGENITTTLTELTQAGGGPETRLSNGAFWDTSDDPPTQAFSDFFVSRIDRDQSVKFNLFNTEDLIDDSGSEVNKIHLYWDNASLESDLELTIIALSNISGKVCESLTKDFFGFAPEEGIEIVLDVPDCPISADEDIFQIRAKALYDDILNFELFVYNEDGDEIEQIESGISIKSVGQFSRSKQAIMIEVPWKLAATGLLDYVIFSEEELIKYREP